MKWPGALVFAVAAIACAACGMFDRDRDLNRFFKAVPMTALRLRAADGTVIWEIRTVGQPTMVRHVQYGEIPDGFIQVTPKLGKPRPFHDGERLALFQATRTTYACDQGRAVGQSGFRQELYETIPTTGTSSEWEVAAGAIQTCSCGR